MHCAGVEEEEAAEATKAATETTVLWGPVTKQVTDAIGAAAAVASVLLRTSSATAEVAARMKALVPVNILPTAGDTPKSLAARLAQSELFEFLIVVNVVEVSRFVCASHADALMA